MNQGKKYRNKYRLQYLAFYKGDQCTISDLIKRKAIIKDEIIANITQNLINCSDIKYLHGFIESELSDTFLIYMFEKGRLTLNDLKKNYRQYGTILNNKCELRDLEISINVRIFHKI